MQAYQVVLRVGLFKMTFAIPELRESIVILDPTQQNISVGVNSTDVQMPKRWLFLLSKQIDQDTWEYEYERSL